MQQTEKRGFNIIETSDAFSPQALNDNTQKIEAALDGLEAYADAGDAAVVSRVVELEKFHFACGHFVGDGVAGRVIPLGFKPIAVLYQIGISYLITVLHGANESYLTLVDEGFMLHTASYNQKDFNYIYVAFGVDE